MKPILHSLVSRYQYLVILLLIGMVTFYWFRGSPLIISNDTLIHLSLTNSISEYFYIWSWRLSNSGIDISKFPYLMPIGILLKWYSIFGLPFSPSIFLKLLIYVIFTSSGISMYLLLNTVCPKAHPYSKIIGSLLYMFNFYIMIIWIPMPLLIINYAILPLILALYIIGMNGKKLSFALTIAVIWTLTITPSYMTLPFVATNWFIILSFFGYYICTNYTNITKIKNATIFTFILLFIWILLNAFWMFPLFKQHNEELQRHSIAGGHDYTAYDKNSVKIIDSIRFKGYKYLTGSYKDSSYYPWYNSYDSLLINFVSFIIPILVFSALFLNKNNQYAIYFAILTLTFIFLVKGSNSPLGEINKLIFSSSNLGFMFRSSYQRFMGYIVMSFAVLATFAFDNIFRCKCFSNKNRMLITGITLCIIGLISYPLLTGDHYNTEGVFPSKRVEVPNYYYDAADWLDSQENNFNVLPIPFQIIARGTFLWDNGTKGYLGIYPMLLISSKRFIMKDFKDGTGSMVAMETIDKENKNNKLLSLFNIRYILYHKDSNWDYIDGNNRWVSDNPDSIQFVLNRSTDMHLEKSFDKLDFYEIDDTIFLPHIYTTNKFIPTQNINTMLQHIKKESFIPGNSIFFLEEEAKFEYLKRLPEYNKSVIVTYNNLNDVSFENLTWMNISDCCSGRPGNASIFASLSSDTSHGGDYSLNLTSENHCACVSQKFINFNNNLYYRLSFDYKHISGQNPSFCVWASGYNNCIPTADLDNSTIWKKYETDLIFPDDSVSASLFFYSNAEQAGRTNTTLTMYFYSDSDGSLKTTNLYDNIRIRKINRVINDTVAFGDYSFENATWGKVGDCCSGRSGMAIVSASLSNDSSDGRTSLDLTSENHCACVNRKVAIEYNASYEISFDYKHISGENPRFCLWRHDLRKCSPEHRLEPFSKWTKYTFEINTPNVEKRTTNLYDNVVLEKVTLVNTLAYHPEMYFKRINPTKYKIKIKDATEPFFLVFSESFHPQWKAYAQDNQRYPEFDDIIAQYDNVKVKEARHEMKFTPKDVFYLLKKPMDEENHFTANGYANSWYIDPKEIDKDGDGNFTVTLYFKPQSYFYLGLAISLTTLLLCILYLIWDWRKNRKTPQKHDAPKNIFREAVSAPWQKQARKEEKTWDAQKERAPREKLESILKSIGALTQSLMPKKAWKAPQEKKGAHEKLIGSISALRKDMQLKKAYPQKTPKKEELWEIKDYFREKKQRPQYSFTPPKKTTFTTKEVDKKMDDIKKRLMLRDKGEDK